MKVAKGNSLIKTGFAALALVFLAAIVISCSSEAPFAPVVYDQTSFKALNSVLNEFGTDPFSTLTDSDGNLAKSGRWEIVEDSDYADVGADGGVITLKLRGAVSTFEIPKDAVCAHCDKDCVVRINAKALLFNTPFGPLVLYDFGPDGLVFDKDCKLKIEAGFKDRVVDLFWFNPDTGVWELEQTVRVDKRGKAEFKIRHFSKYAIS